MDISNLKIAYFGGEPLGVPVLIELQKAGIMPSVVLCNPDRPVGRKRELTPPPVKQWAVEHDITVIQPKEIKSEEFKEYMTAQSFDLFIVVAYNKIMPKWLVELPKYGTINVHPSLLPLLRGASPIRTSILQDMREQCGVTIMQMDEKMDHGPILVQKTLSIPEEQWPVHGQELDCKLAELGGILLSQTIPKYINGEITPDEQPHNEATYCGRLDRSIGELTLDPMSLPAGEEAHKMLLKIRAFDGFPGTFFIHEQKRVKVLDAYISQDALHIINVIPEGKNKMDFDVYLQTLS